MSNTTKTQSLTADQILERILNAKGNFVKVVWKSNQTPAAVHKKAGIILEKHTSAVCRAGINFANLSSVQQGIAEGTRGEVQELPWGRWRVFPHIIEHKDAEYVRVYPTDSRFETIYFVGKKVGNEEVSREKVSKETYASYLIPSDVAKMSSGEKPECFTIKRENIISTEDFGG